MNGSKTPQSPVELDGPPTPNKQSKQTQVVFVGLLIVFGIALYMSRGWLSLEVFSQQETKLQSLLRSNPILVFSGAFLIYVVVAALSIPGGATMLSLVYAWFFKFWAALVLISFASTAGATVARDRRCVLFVHITTDPRGAVFCHELIDGIDHN